MDRVSIMFFLKFFILMLPPELGVERSAVDAVQVFAAQGHLLDESHLVGVFHKYNLHIGKG